MTICKDQAAERPKNIASLLTECRQGRFLKQMFVYQSRLKATSIILVKVF